MSINQKKITVELLSHQADFINSDCRYLLNSGGVGSGKTFSLVLKTLRHILENPGIFILIGAQTYPLLRDTTLREFLNVVPSEMIESFNRSNNHFKFTNGSEVIFRSFDDPNKLKSLNLGACAVEEMSDIPEEIFKMLRTRLRQDGMPCCLYGATNPNTFGNWVYRYFIDEPIAKSEVIYSISADNEFLPAEYLEDLSTLKKSNPEYYERMVMGRWGMLEGVIYNLPMSQRITEIPPMKRYFAGLDFGFTHPSAFVIIGQRENKYYIVDEVYRYKMTSQDIIDAIKEKMTKYDIDIIYCDSSRPEIIEDLQRQQIPAVGGIKDVFDGIMYVKSLIGGEKLLVNTDCTSALREFDSYIWDVKNTVKEIPLKVNDHCFIGKHKVLTLRGNIRLDKLRESEFIYTRYGFKKVLKIHKHIANVRDNYFSGKKFCCTDEHPFYVLEKNMFKNVLDLTHRDTLYKVHKERYLKCQKNKLLKQLFLMESNSGDTLSQNMVIIESISPVIAIIMKKGLDICIGKYGSRFMEKFQKVVKYIIKTAIRIIMKLKILNVLILISIYQNIRKNGILRIKNNLKRILMLFAIKRLTGISQKREENGTPNMLKRLLEICLMYIVNVSFVEWIIQQRKTNNQFLNSVLTIARVHIGENREKMKLSFPALNVEKNFILINTRSRNIVQEVVVKNRTGRIKKAVVYNLTVDEKPEYFVDGILVHNCMDAIRYGLYTDNREGGISKQIFEYDAPKRVSEEMDF